MTGSAEGPGATKERRVLLVLTSRAMSTHPLPEGARLSIGRSRDNDIWVDDASVSRHHAVIHTGPPVCVEDLGSANGTRIRDVNSTALDPQEGGATVPHKDVVVPPNRRVEVGAANLIRVGSAILVVQAASLGTDGSPRSAEVRKVIVRDPGMERLFAVVERVADSSISVLLMGETGVGKEVFAERLVERSSRRNKPFVRLNCSALSESLLESELFGHERGAFTGAVQPKMGLLETANEGTVFLDEVGELPLSLQVKLLRVLEEGQVLRVGATRARRIDVRFIAATNRDLDREVASGAFRQDLYFRLAGVNLFIPPLRERTTEIQPLAAAFAAEASRRARRTEPSLSRETLDLLGAYSWPGNIRELRNVIERAVLLSGGAAITPEHLPLDRMPSAETGAAPPSSITIPPTERVPTFSTTPAASFEDVLPEGAPARETSADLKDRLEQLERERIEQALTECAGNQTRAAEMLGISRGTLVARIKAFGLKRPRKRPQV